MCFQIHSQCTSVNYRASPFSLNFLQNRTGQVVVKPLVSLWLVYFAVTKQHHFIHLQHRVS